MIVDDEPHNLEILRIFLKSLHYDIHEAECGADALKLIDEKDPDLILLDVMMPDISGFELAKLLHERPGFDTPIIFLSAKAQKEDVLRGLQLGAFDYLTKPFDLDLLEKKVSIALAHQRKVTALRQENVQLAGKAFVDTLTGLYNRAYLETVMDMIRQGAKTFQVVMMIDIDHFKYINDKHGHLVGDEVLKKVAQILLSRIDLQTDLAFRYGGDEFLVFLQDAAKRMEVAESIIQDVSSLTAESKFEGTTHVTVSVGMTCSLEEDTSIEQIISRSDTALYGAKNLGRNRLFVC
nr:diguanylate cyclase [Paenibacillus hamazuiensis]